MRKLLMAVGCCAVLAACAQGPDAVAPVSMAGAFDTLSCSKTRTMLNQERQRQAALEEKQRSAVAGDAIGVFLIGVPVSSLSGNDVAGELGTAKGKVIALENRMMRC